MNSNFICKNCNNSQYLPTLLFKKHCSFCLFNFKEYAKGFNPKPRPMTF